MTPKTAIDQPNDPTQSGASSPYGICRCSIKQAAYIHRQIDWLQDRFPKADLENVPGLVRLVAREEIAAADWSLTPGRYVGVASVEEDEEFDFESVIRGIHSELAELDRESVELRKAIQQHFAELAI